MKNNPFQWSRAALSFFGRNGRAVPQALTKGAAEAVCQKAKFNILDLGLQLQQGAIGVDEFYEAFKAEIKMAHGAAIALARGGFSEMRPSDWQRAEEVAAEQFEYARGFVEDVAAGRYGTPGATLRQAALTRGGSYADAPRAAYENERTEMHRESGFSYATRIKGAVDSCPTCEAEADVKRPIDEVVPIGDSECRSQCHCVLIYSRD